MRTVGLEVKVSSKSTKKGAGKSRKGTKSESGDSGENN